MKRGHLYILAAILASAGLGIFIYKAFFLELPLRPMSRVKNWEIETKVQFKAQDAGVKLSLFIPRNGRSLTMIDESFLSEGYGVTMASDAENRRALFSIRKASGEQTVYYRFVIHHAQLSREMKPETEPIPEKPRFSDAELAAADRILESLKAKSTNDTTLTRLVLEELAAATLSKDAAMLLGPDTSAQRRMVLAGRILALEGIPARPVNGVRLVNFSSNAKIRHWLEAYINGRWQQFDAQTGAKLHPAKMFAWWRGPSPLATVDGGDDLKTTLIVSSASVPALHNAVVVNRARGGNLLAYSLFSLPASTQQVFKIILTIPIGVFLLTLIRNVVGLRTIGTFMPVLIAIAFRDTHLLLGVCLFTLVVSIGVIVRLYLSTLRLLMVPRLASVLIIVVLTMAGISVLSTQLGLLQGLSVALFPMVIMTMVVERVSIIWDERGPVQTLRMSITSLAVAALIYPVMLNPYVEHLCLVFPELLLVVLACTLLLGHYSGYRLLDFAPLRFLSQRGN